MDIPLLVKEVARIETVRVYAGKIVSIYRSSSKYFVLCCLFVGYVQLLCYQR